MSDRSSQSATRELSPCPFCGGEALLEELPNIREPYFCLGCNNAGCAGHRVYDAWDWKHRDECIAAWNRRPSTLQSAETRGPTFYCMGCGELNKHRRGRIGAPTDGYDYDLECTECGSTTFSESLGEAFGRAMGELDTLRAEKSETRQQALGIASSTAQIAEPCRRLGCRFEVAQNLLDRAKERGELSEAERASVVQSAVAKSTPTTQQREAISDVLCEMRRRMREGGEDAINWLAMPYELFKAMSPVSSTAAIDPEALRLAQEFLADEHKRDAAIRAVEYSVGPKTAAALREAVIVSRELVRIADLGIQSATGAPPAGANAEPDPELTKAAKS